MTNPRPPRDITITCKIGMPAGTYQRIREHAARSKTSISRLCREGAIAEIDRLEAAALAVAP